MTQIIENLRDISAQYDALFVDLWGCVHNGVTALPDAVAALQDYRATGGTVVLVTNSPRPRVGVEKQLVHFGVPQDAWDSIATSGDSARSAMFSGVVGQDVWFIGHGRDQKFFEPMKLLEHPITITQVEPDKAQGIVCTGPADPMADPNEMRPQFEKAIARGLKFLCANPDIVVDRGDVREWCAGALAALYTEMGGESLYFGKPHPPIYDLARRRLAATGRSVADDRILAIGDGAQTDIMGAMGQGIDALFITGGLAASDTRTTVQPDPGALKAYLTNQQITPAYTIGFLR